MKIRHWLLLFLMFLIPACGGSGGVDGTTGTIVNKPGPPKDNAFPSFDTYIPDTTLGSSSRTLSSSKSAPTRLDEGFSIPELWEGVFLTGGINDMRNRMQNLKDYGPAIINQMALDGFTTITSDEERVIVTGNDLIDITNGSSWKINFALESTDEHYIRFDFINGTTDLQQATYLVALDSEGNPVKGLFAYTKPEAITADADGSITPRLIEIAFDFTDPAKYLIIMRVDQYFDALGTFYAYQIYEQFDSTTNTGIGEYLEISDTSPARTIEENGIRFSWNETTGAVCIADMDYSEGTLGVRATYSFTGPETPTEDELVVDTCSVTTPHWGTHIFTGTELPLRVNDTDPIGGTSNALNSNYDSVIPDLIDTWLDATLY